MRRNFSSDLGSNFSCILLSGLSCFVMGQYFRVSPYKTLVVIIISSSHLDPEPTVSERFTRSPLSSRKAVVNPFYLVGVRVTRC